MSDYIPTAPAIVREAICVAAGALLVVALVRLMPPNIQKFFLLQKVNQQ
ncbi:hypothetical protein [Dechloromonas sp. HYN0024]|nr:hypothetical protein [Dechloromonas sp. HYN0024]